MKKSLNLAAMLAVAGGLAVATVPSVASATCSPAVGHSCSARACAAHKCSAKPKKVKKVKAAKANPCAAKANPCAAKAAPCAAKAGPCAAKPCAPKA